MPLTADDMAKGRAKFRAKFASEDELREHYRRMSARGQASRRARKAARIETTADVQDALHAAISNVRDALSVLTTAAERLTTQAGAR